MNADKRAAYARWLRELAADIAERLEDGRITDIKVEHAAATEAKSDDYYLRWVKNGMHTLTVTWYDPSTRGAIEEDDDERRVT